MLKPQSSSVLGSFSYSGICSSRVAGATTQLQCIVGCSTNGRFSWLCFPSAPFLTRTHRTAPKPRHGTISSRAGGRCPAPGIIMDKGQIAISRCRTSYKSVFISLDNRTPTMSTDYFSVFLKKARFLLSWTQKGVRDCTLKFFFLKKSCTLKITVS
jgi:hypothetical protein